MDKNEFKTKYDEIKQLIKEGRTDEALDIVESTNWRKVHNVNALVKASEVCEEYQINKAKGADYTTLIGILEELKEHDFLEEWAYELAYLYHKTMQVDKCIDLCDEIILWFGDGPYVERALEMKMIYQPLDKMQEDKYRHFQQRRDGVTEIRANEILHSGEIVHETMAIPQVELPAERFNTVNLQAEIKKNIDEIMRATEAEAVSENMENIKTLVEEIPYLQVNEQSDAIAEEQKQAKQELDESLKDTFNEYLAEEYDGQISLLVPESKEVEQQVDGQMTIEDVMEEWEKTRRAAEAALQEAEQQKLESAKNIALKEASQIMDRLEEAIPKLDAGARPTDLLKEEYMAKQDEASSEPVKDRTEDPAPAVFQIPKVEADGVMGVGLEIPVVDPASAHIIKGEESPEAPSIVKSVEPDASEEWHPPVLEDQDEKADPAQEASLPEEADLEEVTDVDYKEASKIVADVNDMLQQEIDRIMANEGQEEVRHLEEETLASEVAEEIAPDVEEDDLPEITLPEDLQEFVAEAETAESEVGPQEAVAEEAMPSREQEVAEEPLPEIADVVLDPEEMAELLDENVLERAISEEMPELTLSEEEKEIFSYFMPIDGMENTICQALTGVRYRLENKKNSASGNIIIQGGVGSGKTMLASNLIKVLQIETDKLTGNVGKIDAEQLNKKDVALVLSKVSGGCLIIEGAGRLSERTQETMRQLMSQENCDVLVLMEDQKKRIVKMLSHNSAFAAMFTEKITIPIFTIDELVNFGKVYALEEGYVVDEMAILAMYNRINLIQRVDHPTSLIEVRDIVESAIDKAEKGGIKAMFSRFGSKRYDEDGNLILREQDFEL